ncbi:hypothetical protein DVH05_012341 [Phytophthora capsici]|nr:hypothetical protein DVH05_012341 [Phytophthora capsici]
MTKRRAYPADISRNTIVPAYKKGQHGTDKKAISIWVAHARVVNEHTIGVLKGRFSSLRELRIQIREKEDMKKILFWVNECVVLHNILLSLNDEWSSEEDSTDTVDDAEEDSDSDSDDDRFPFRKHIKTRAIAKAREQGGIRWYRGV